MDLPSSTDLKEFVSALAPGLIILWIRQRIVAAPIPSLQDRVISYAAISAVYYALANPAFDLLAQRTTVPLWVAASLEYVMVPAAIGIIAAIATSRDWETAWWNKIGLHPVHHVPTGWDYAFSRLTQGTFIIVTLTDGSQVAGAYAGDSFASSISGERDLLIGEVWDLDEGGVWTYPKNPRSILLCGRDIRSIELFRNAEKSTEVI